MTRILLAVDGSGQDVSSVEWLGKLFGGVAATVEITVLHVAHLRMPGPSSIRLGFVPRLPSREDLEGIESQTRTEADEIVTTTKEDLENYGFVVTTMVEWGPTPDVILEVAEANNCDMIAMGRHGAGRVTDLIAGSVSGRVIRRAGVPVLILRADPPE